MAAPTSEQIIRQMFATFTDFSTSLDQLKAFLTPDYRQIVDGHTLTLNDFLAHAQALRETLQSLEITVERIICQEDMAATVHVARAIRPSGHISTLRVIAFFQFRKGHIALVDELTHVLEGNSEDKTLGSLQ